MYFSGGMRLGISDQHLILWSICTLFENRHWEGSSVAERSCVRDTERARCVSDVWCLAGRRLTCCLCTVIVIGSFFILLSLIRPMFHQRFLVNTCGRQNKIVCTA
jgi:hypothetical protein